MIKASPLKFEEQLAYFRQKVNVKTNSYLDVQGAEHDYLFMVAGANRNEIVNEFREAVRKAIEDGTTLEEFRKDFDKIVEQTGWKYNGGRGWRTRIIYDTNLYGSYNKGRLAQHLDLKDVMPYWEYVHNDNAHPRKEHMSWDGLVLPADDTWWTYHYPIKAYGCHCEVIAHTEKDLQRMGRAVDTPPPIEWEEKLVGQRSGNIQTVRIPKGYDPGFTPHDFKNLWRDKHLSADKVLFNKMVTAEPAFAALAVSNVLENEGAVRLLNESTADMVRRVVQGGKQRGEVKYVGVIPAEVIEKLDNLGKMPQSAVIAVRDDDILHAVRDLKQNKNIALPLSFWEQLPEKLRHPKAILFQPKELLGGKDPRDTLLFIYDTDSGMAVVKMDYGVDFRSQLTNKKRKVRLNIVRTATILKDFTGIGGLKVLWGTLK